MLKAAGLVLIIIAGTGIGFSKSLELTYRERALGTILRMVICLKGEIRCGNASLHDAFCGAARKLPGVYGEFLRDTACELQKNTGCPFNEIFRMCAKRHLGELSLTKEEQEKLFSLGEHLGYLDLDMQMRQLEIYERDLEQDIDRLRLDMPGRKKAYQSLGILGGVLLAVLVW